jgi:signal transduction histidine kinase
MITPPSKKQRSLRSIYTVLAIGFFGLLILIWLMGTLSKSKLNQMSIKASESASDYQYRLTLALNIRATAASVISEARLVRTRRITPFKIKLSQERSKLEKYLADGAKLWDKREQLDTVKGVELLAWRQVESAAEKFREKLDQIEKANESNREGNQQDPGTSQNASAPVSQSENSSRPAPPLEPELDNFLQLRNELEIAAEGLAQAVIKVHGNELFEFVTQRQNDATAISAAGLATLFIGILVATITFGIVRNQLSQLRRANKLEQEAKDFTRSIFDSQSNDIIVVSRNGELLVVNKAFSKHFNLPAQSLVLQDYHAAFAHLPEIEAFVGQALEQPDNDAGLRERIEVKPRYDQTDPNAFVDARLFDVYISPLTIGGQNAGRVIVLVDVTEAEQVREELRRSRALSAIGQITAKVAHELYNPIGAVKLNIDLLDMQIPGDDDVKHTVARLKRGVEHLSTIVMDLRYLTRPRDPERKPTDLNRLLDEVIELAGERLERSRVYITRKYAPRLPQGQFDPQQLRKVFLNLLINAVEASTHDSDVELTTRYVSGNGASCSTDSNGSRGALVISVIDHGMGMSLETKRRLFEAFYTTKRNGTGLGMMITQEIVKKHGGKIEVDSEEGKGTVVNVYLPV